MPYYSTQQGGNMTDAANALARIFVGDPKADAEYRNQQIKNETEFARQKILAQQEITEGVRQEQLRAAAAASYAAAAANRGLADERTRKNDSATNLGNIFTQDHRDFTQPGGMSMPGDAPAGTPGAGFDLNNPAIASQVVQNVMTGEIDPKVLSSMAIMPGQSDATLGRIMVGAGNTIGKDDYVSIEDRNANRNYELGAGERLVGGNGQVQTGVDASYSDAQSALANQRNATARLQNTRAQQPGGSYKVPKLDQSQMNSMLINALLAHGAQIPRDDKGAYSMGAAQYLATQPEVFADMARIVEQAYRLSGGNAAAVQNALAQYIGQGSFAPVTTGGSDFIPFNESTSVPTLQGMDVDQLLQAIQAQYGQNSNLPAIFTEGGEAGLPNLQDVGNTGGWKIIGVQ